jgi:hypothetical protein
MGRLRGQLLLCGVIAAVVVAAGSVATARAAVPSGNLVVNGDAEGGTGSTDSATTAPVPIPDWTTTTNFTEHTYDPAGSQNFPDANASAAIDGGSQFFAGGPSNGSGNAVETATQDVNVSTAASEIDRGGVVAALSADLGGFASQDDQAKVTATFLGADAQQSGAITIGPVTAADRADTTKLLARTGSAMVPRGTRVIRVVMTATKFAGAYNDAYLDNISLSLSPPPAIGKTVDVTPVSGQVFVQLPAGTPGGSPGQGFVPLTQAGLLPVGTKIDARAGTVELVSAADGGGKTQSGTFGGALFGFTQSAKGKQKGLTTLSLLEGAFPGAPSYALCKAKPAGARHGAAATAARVNRRVLQLLHATASGRFSTRGRYSAATVRGTIWDTTDRCDGTLTRVRRGTVVVTDFARHKTVIVRAGHSYLAKAPRR